MIPRSTESSPTAQNLALMRGSLMLEGFDGGGDGDRLGWWRWEGIVVENWVYWLRRKGEEN